MFLDKGNFLLKYEIRDIIFWDIIKWAVRKTINEQYHLEQ